jgi:hypothetical protein
MRYPPPWIPHRTNRFCRRKCAPFHPSVGAGEFRHSPVVGAAARWKACWMRSIGRGRVRREGLPVGIAARDFKVRAGGGCAGRHGSVKTRLLGADCALPSGARRRATLAPTGRRGADMRTARSADPGAARPYRNRSPPGCVRIRADPAPTAEFGHGGAEPESLPMARPSRADASSRRRSRHRKETP